jgi:hypothetical protein
VSGWLPSGVSDRLRRLHGEPVGLEPKLQVKEFVDQCVAEGLASDAIVIMARAHEPSVELYGGGMLDDAIERRVAAALPTHAPSGDQVKFIDWFSAGADDQPESPCIAGLVSSGASVSLTGPAKVGKSLLVLEAVAAKAAGTPFLGTVPPAGPVLYWDCENRESVVRQRLAAMGFRLADLGDLHYVTLPLVPRLDTPRTAATALRLAENIQAQLVVLDTTQRVIGGDEESSAGIRALYEHFLTPLRRARVAVLRLDNTGKDVSRGARGSSAKSDDVDAALMLTARADGNLHLATSFSRAAPGEDLVLQRQSDPLQHVLLGEPEDIRVAGASRRGADRPTPLMPSNSLRFLTRWACPPPPADRRPWRHFGTAVSRGARRISPPP